MTAKEYLKQAYRLNQRVNSKLEMLETLKQLATKCTSTVSGMPSGSKQSTSTMADTIEKIVDMKGEIDIEINRLVKLIREITNVIKLVKNPEHQMLLERRYVCFCSWEQIAVDMNYSIQHTFRIHGRAMKEIEKILKDESKCD